MTIQMIESNADEIFHLFNVMKQNGAGCSLELKTNKSLDPVISVPQVPVDIEYFESTDGPDALIVKLGDSDSSTDFSFELGIHSFSKYISNCQIFICIQSDDYVAWFNSGVISPEGIKDAKGYKPSEDTDLIPLVEGMNPYNQLDDRSDLDHAIMDVCIEVEEGKIPHEEAAFGRISKIIDAYLDRHYGKAE